VKWLAGIMVQVKSGFAFLALKLSPDMVISTYDSPISQALNHRGMVQMLWVGLIPDRVRVKVPQHHHRALIKDFGVHFNRGCNRTDIGHFLPLYRPYSKQRKAYWPFNPDRDNTLGRTCLFW